MIILGFRKLVRIKEFPQGSYSCRSYCTTNNLLQFTIVENNKHWKVMLVVFHCYRNTRSMTIYFHWFNGYSIFFLYLSFDKCEKWYWCQYLRYPEIFSCSEVFLISLSQKKYCKILPWIADQYLLSYIAVTIIFLLLHIIFQEWNLVS